MASKERIMNSTDPYEAMLELIYEKEYRATKKAMEQANWDDNLVPGGPYPEDLPSHLLPSPTDLSNELCKCGAQLTMLDEMHKRTMCFGGCSASPNCSKCGRHMDYYSTLTGEGVCEPHWCGKK